MTRDGLFTCGDQPLTGGDQLFHDGQHLKLAAQAPLQVKQDRELEVRMSRSEAGRQSRTARRAAILGQRAV